MKGTEIKAAIVSAGLKNYEVAEAFGITETSFSRKLRADFNDSDTKRVLEIIKSLENAK